MKQILCSRCKKNPAVVFVSKAENDKSEPVGYCLKCAMELNIGPVKQMMNNMGITEDDIDAVSEQFNSIMGFSEDEDFEEGGAPSMPSLQSLFGALGGEDGMPFGGNAEDGITAPEENESESEEGKTKKKKRGKKGAKGDAKKRRYLNTYCTDLTAKAREGKIDRIIGREKEINRAVQILCRRSKKLICSVHRAPHKSF